MLTLEPVYLLIGAFLLFAAALDFRSRRLAMAAFWAILSLPFLAGEAILAAARHGTHWPAQAMGATWEPASWRCRSFLRAVIEPR